MQKRELPEGWESCTLLSAVGGDEQLIVSGPFGSNLKVEHYCDQGVPIVRLQNIGNGEFLNKDIKYISQEKAKELQYHSFQSGDLILTKLGEPIGKTCLIPDYLGNGIVVSDVVRIRNGNSDLSSKYLMYLLNSTIVSNQLNNRVFGTTRQRVNLDDVRELKIPLPPLPVQRRIVEILEQADALRHLRTEADAETQKLLQSVFYEMFGDPVRNEKGWEIRKIEDLCSVVTDGEHITPIRKDLGIYLLSARNIQNHKIALSDVDFIDNEEYNRISQRIKPKRSDILLSCSGTIGRVAQIKTEEKFQLVRSVALLRPIEHLINPTYLEYSFDTHFLKNQIQKNVHQSSQGNLFQGKIKQLKVIVPPMNLQIHFARITQKVESVQANQKESHEEIFHLFDGLMTGLFKGEYLTKVT